MNIKEPKLVEEIISPMIDGAIRPCEECGNGFVLPPFRIAAKFVKICPSCSEIRAELDMQKARESARDDVRRGGTWKRVCPEEFQKTERGRIPNPIRFDRVMQWKFGSRGMVLHGPTGRGKSRCAWELMRREHMQGRSWDVLDSRFAYSYSAQFSKPSDCAKWIKARIELDILLLDDVFKTKLTDSVEQAVFAIVNHRTEEGRPVILTTQDVGETLEQRMSPDRGPALVRRIREFCESISFS